VPVRPKNLPDFDRPPVTEVVLSLQFGSLTKLKSAYIGFLWSKFRDRYPVVTEQPPLDPVFETFGSLALGSQALQLQQLMLLPMPRYWFETAEGSNLCQVQQDRLVHNWRKRQGEYPRYEVVRSELEKDLNVFQEFLATEDLGRLDFNQVEITYINTIDLPDGGDPHGSLARVMAVWTDMDSPERDLEDVFLRSRYLIKKDETPYARLHVSVIPGVHTATMAKVVQLQLTFRGKPDGNDRAAAFALMDDGRETIVTAFAELTTPDMHQHWGRTDVSR
jgi:uncharacterized protein (TIGR04255 family)